MSINKPVSAIIIIIIALIILFLFTMPKYQKYNESQKSLVQKQVEYSTKAAYYANIEKLIGNIQSKKDGLQKIDSALPPRFYFAPLVYFFGAKGLENGVTVKSITFSSIAPPTLSQTPSSIAFKINVSANYEHFKKFLASLDRSARLFEVNAISFSASANAGSAKQSKDQNAIYDFNLDMQTNTY